MCVLHVKVGLHGSGPAAAFPCLRAKIRHLLPSSIMQAQHNVLSLLLKLTHSPLLLIQVSDARAKRTWDFWCGPSACQSRLYHTPGSYLMQAVSVFLHGRAAQ